MRATWLADVLREAGCKVVELDGWELRGKELETIHGVVWHHTATGRNWLLQAVLDMLRLGRSDLAGPLSQLGLDRDGTFYVVAAGKANHNGYGEWGNQAIGIEALNDGIGEPWPVPQLDAFHIGTAAILRHLGKTADCMKGHRETDPKRKPDPEGIDLDAARRRIAHLIANLPEETPMTESERKMLEELHSAFIGSDAPPKPGAFRRVLQKSEALADAFGIGSEAAPKVGAFRRALARAAARVKG